MVFTFYSKRSSSYCNIAYLSFLFWSFRLLAFLALALLLSHFFGVSIFSLLHGHFVVWSLLLFTFSFFLQVLRASYVSLVAASHDGIFSGLIGWTREFQCDCQILICGLLISWRFISFHRIVRFEILIFSLGLKGVQMFSNNGQFHFYFWVSFIGLDVSWYEFSSIKYWWIVTMFFANEMCFCIYLCEFLIQYRSFVVWEVNRVIFDWSIMTHNPTEYEISCEIFAVLRIEDACMNQFGKPSTDGRRKSIFSYDLQSSSIGASDLRLWRSFLSFH